MALLRNHWYTACAASRLGAAPRAARVLDQDLVLFRDGAGVPRALLDRCCHRGYKLSLGQVRDGVIECGFHGWCFDGASGKCAQVPSLRTDGRIPDAFAVPAFECVEKDGYIWVWMGQGDTRPTAPPSIPEFAGGRWTQGAQDLACEATKAIEINLDGAHVYFVHPTHPATIAFRAQGSVRRDNTSEVRVLEDGVIMFWPATASASDPIPKDRGYIQFQLPNLVRLTTTYGGRTYTILLFFVTTGERTCRLEYAITPFAETAQPVEWSDEVPQIFEEDRRILEIIQQTSDREGEAFERSVEADTASLLARKILRAAARNEWPGSRAALETRRIVTSRM
jgi:phenylpropionate dioxygenase-like ring-hydroxylating dioxygenase large terminal subunit